MGCDAQGWNDEALQRITSPRRLRDILTHQVQPIEGVTSLEIFLVITDMNMPGRNGMSLIEKLRERRRTRLTSILFLTTESNAEVKPDAKEKGATGWLSKPFSPDSLLQTVERALK